MALDESRMAISSTQEDENDVWFHPHNFSKSTSSSYSSDDDDMGRLSIESFDADADEELLQLSPDSDKEACYYSLPTIPTHGPRLKEMKKKDGVVVMARPKGGRRSMCMDMEEVKACRDLGFELDLRVILMEMPLTPFPSLDNANSPISNCLISTPGDDPRDVKARLKVWAQAVARASASMLCS